MTADSFILNVSTGESRDELLARIVDLLDTSNMPDGHPLKSDKFRGCPGYWKLETPNSLIVSFASPREKTYSLKLRRLDYQRWSAVDVEFGAMIDSDDVDKWAESTTNRCRGLPKASRDALTHQDYIDTISGGIRGEGERKMSQVVQIRMRNFHLDTVRQDRIALAPTFCKRWLYDCGLHSIPFGHPRAKNTYSSQCLECARKNVIHY